MNLDEIEKIVQRTTDVRIDQIFKAMQTGLDLAKLEFGRTVNALSAQIKKQLDDEAAKTEKSNNESVPT